MVPVWTASASASKTVRASVILPPPSVRNAVSSTSIAPPLAGSPWLLAEPGCDHPGDPDEEGAGDDELWVLVAVGGLEEAGIGCRKKIDPVVPEA